MSLFVNPTQFNEAADLAAYPRDEQRDAGLAAEQRRRLPVRPAGRQRCTRRVCHHGRVARRHRAARGRHRGRGHFDGVATVVSKLFNIVGAGRRLLRSEGRPAGAGDQAARRATSTSRSGSRSARPCASRRARAVEPQRAAVRRRARARRAALQPGAAAGAGRWSPPASATRRRALAAGSRRAGRRRASSPSTSQIVDPDTLEPVTRRGRRALAWSPPGSAPYA